MQKITVNLPVRVIEEFDTFCHNNHLKRDVFLASLMSKYENCLYILPIPVGYKVQVGFRLPAYLIETITNKRPDYFFALINTFLTSDYRFQIDNLISKNGT